MVPEVISKGLRTLVQAAVGAFVAWLIAIGIDIDDEMENLIVGGVFALTSGVVAFVWQRLSLWMQTQGWFKYLSGPTDKTAPNA